MDWWNGGISILKKEFENPRESGASLGNKAFECRSKINNHIPPVYCKQLLGTGELPSTKYLILG